MCYEHFRSSLARLPSKRVIWGRYMCVVVCVPSFRRRPNAQRTAWSVDASVHHGALSTRLRCTLSEQTYIRTHSKHAATTVHAVTTLRCCFSAGAKRTWREWTRISCSFPVTSPSSSTMGGLGCVLCWRTCMCVCVRSQRQFLRMSRHRCRLFVRLFFQSLVRYRLHRSRARREGPSSRSPSSRGTGKRLWP